MRTEITKSTTLVSRSFDGVPTAMWECAIAIYIGDREMHLCALADTAEDAEREAERVFAQAVDNLARIGEVWQRTGQLNWGGLEAA
jgi:hypothetical protein